MEQGRHPIRAADPLSLPGARRAAARCDETAAAARQRRRGGNVDRPSDGRSPARVAFYNDPKVRSIVYQVALCAIVGFLVYGAVTNAIDNLERAHIATGFGFWNTTAGFDISQTLIP